MKRLVNEFRDYARLPVAELEALDLNLLIHDVSQLYSGAELQHPDLHIDFNLEDGLPAIHGDAAQLRQVLHNLLQNAIDAVTSQGQQEIHVKTEFQTMGNQDNSTGRVCLLITDSGEGFPEKMLKTVFEPYVTTKAHGTGLGLAVVKKIMDEHHARIDISNLTNKAGKIQGAQVLLSFPIAAVNQALEK